MDMELYSVINTLITIFLGGGWFLHYRASKRKAYGEAKQIEAEANKQAQEYYNSTLADVNKTLCEVREERDHYKDDRNFLRKENEEMRVKYTQLEEQLTNMSIEYKKDIARLGRRIDVLSPFLCGVVGCLHRKRVSIVDELNENKEQEQTKENVQDGDN